MVVGTPLGDRSADAAEPADAVRVRHQGNVIGAIGAIGGPVGP